MKSFQLFFLALLLGLFIGCSKSDPCEDVECGPGDCVAGTCDCPDGFSGVNCEIELCFGAECINGDCDPQTETCNCFDGFEGIKCETESRDSFLGWWSSEQWTLTTQSVDTTFQGPSLGSIKFECGNSIPEIEFFPTENSSGLMLLNSGDRIVGRVTEKIINFELQYLTTEVSVCGSASLGDDLNLNLELNFFNHTTSLTEVARGIFRVSRHFKDCN